MEFDIASCRAAAKVDRLEDWIHGYLTGGPWANAGLSNGLRLRQRHWVGPVLLRLDAMERCCGPEPGMEYSVEAQGWRRKVSGMASRLADSASLPPLIVEWRSGRFSVRDGNHRHAAMTQAGWEAGYAVAWFNDPADCAAAQKALAAAGADLGPKS